MGETCKDRHSSICKGILLYAPAAGSLLHGNVTAISKSAEKRLETIKQPAIGACGLQVWKVAQLVEQEANPSPRFDSWLSNLSRKNYKPADCGKHFQHKAPGSSWVPFVMRRR